VYEQEHDSGLSMKVGIAGFGTIGGAVGSALDAGIYGLALAGVCARTPAKARAALSGYRSAVVLMDAEELAHHCDIVVECVPKESFAEIALPALRAGRVLVTVSAAGLLEHPEYVDIARKSGGKIILATGALLGLDAVRAAAEGEIYSVTMITRKPPRSLLGAPFLAANGIDITELSEPLRLFNGSAAEGARWFPANVNVAAALGLAGVGPERTQLEIWADPELERNTHTVRVDADSARFEMSIENVPSAEKPGTGKITALSVIAALRGLTSPLKVGS
jgi:aspartate dehydrogenase